MLQDNHGRKINYLRVSVTDRCNYFCRYCRPEGGVPLKKHSDILSLEELYEIIKYFVEAGIDKVRLTGGEPLVRKNLVWLVSRLSHLPGLKDLCMTTNASMLARHAHALRASGLKRVNISLDTLDPDKFAYMTMGGKLDDVLEGICTAKMVGFAPIKINMVVIKGFNDGEVKSMTKFANDAGMEIRLIKQMNLRLGERYLIENAEAGQCERCNRLRLTCDGFLKPCLFSDAVVDLRRLTKERALHQALMIKPKQGTYNTTDCMAAVGG